MECKVINNQYIYAVSKGAFCFFYNSLNGNIGYAKSIDKLSSDFYAQTEDLFVDLQSVEYEQLYLVVSENCNFRCKYCRQSKASSPRNMSCAEIKNAIDIFLSNSSKPKSIIFFGGEPLINFEGIRFAIQYIRNCGLDISYSMVINGSLCSPEIANYLAQNHVEVIVSLDGPEDIHNNARIYEGGRHTYQQALQGYTNLKNAGCTTGITAVIGPHNETRFDELVNWAIQLRPNTLGFCMPHGDNSNFAMKVSSFHNIHDQMISAYAKLRIHGIKLVQVEQKLKRFIEGKTVPFDCKACGKRIVACPGGRFGICEGAITRRELFHKKLTELNGDISAYKKSTPFNIVSCRSCIAYRICGGGCCYDKLTRYGRVDIADKYQCGLSINIAEYAIKYIADNLPLIYDSYILKSKDRELLIETL